MVKETKQGRTILTADDGKVFKIKDTEYYVGKRAIIGGRLLNGKDGLLETPIEIREDNVEEVPAKPFIPVEDDEEDIEEE